MEENKTTMEKEMNAYLERAKEFKAELPDKEVIPVFFASVKEHDKVIVIPIIGLPSGHNHRAKMFADIGKKFKTDIGTPVKAGFITEVWFVKEKTEGASGLEFVDKVYGKYGSLEYHPERQEAMMMITRTAEGVFNLKTYPFEVKDDKIIYGESIIAKEDEAFDGLLKYFYNPGLLDTSVN